MPTPILSNISPETHAIREDLEKQFDDLTLEAEALYNKQPRSTQLALQLQIGKIYAKYSKHGSQVRLSVNLMQWLKHDDGALSITADDLEHAELKRTEREASCSSDEGMETETDSYSEPELDDIKEPAPLQGPLRTNDLCSSSLITDLPFSPADINIFFPDTLHFPPLYLTAIINIINLTNIHANALLFHHTSKYGPAPILRAGISQHITSSLETIFESSAQHTLGLTSETRALLRSVYERHPQVNNTELRILSRAARVGVETVRMFWEDMTTRRRAVMGMRVFMAAREIMGNKRAREEGSW